MALASTRSMTFTWAFDRTSCHALAKSSRGYEHCTKGLVSRRGRTVRASSKSAPLLPTEPMTVLSDLTTDSKLKSWWAYRARVTRYSAYPPSASITPISRRSLQIMALSRLHSSHCPHPWMHSTTTRSPSSWLVTFLPSETTVPESSCPGTIGYFALPDL